MINTRLTDAETAMLEDAGVDVDERPDDTDPMLDYATELAAIQATSLTPETLSQTLGITPEAVRQMIREKALYAVSDQWKAASADLSDRPEDAPSQHC